MLAAGVAALTFAAGALAKTGELTYAGCFEDVSVGGPCAGAQGFIDPNQVAVSQDGTSVYVTDSTDRTLVRFDRSTQSGALTFGGCIESVGVDTGCFGEAEGLGLGVAASGDGTSVYVGGSSKLTMFDRNPQSLDLGVFGCFEDAGGATSCTDVEGLGGPTVVAVSPNSRAVYVSTGGGDDAVVRFDRDPQTRVLSPAECFEDTGKGTACDDTDGLNGARSLAVSPDRKSVYAAGGDDSALVAFTSDPDTLDLSVATCFEDEDEIPDTGCTDVKGLAGATRVAVSPDNKSVYVVSNADDSIVTFDRNTATGALTAAACFEDLDHGGGCPDTLGLDWPDAVAVSPDGRSVYVASREDSALVRFDRDTGTGALTPRDCVEDVGEASSCADLEGLGGAERLAVSSDGRSLYLTSDHDNRLLRFNRDPLDVTPPQTRITKKPRKRSERRRVRIRFTSTEAESSFQCKLDRKPFRACVSPFRKRVRPRRHRFLVRAIDEDGNVDPTPAKARFRVLP